MECTKFFCELAVLDYHFTTLKPSSIGLAALMTAMEGVDSSHLLCEDKQAFANDVYQAAEISPGDPEVMDCRTRFRTLYYEGGVYQQQQEAHAAAAAEIERRRKKAAAQAQARGKVAKGAPQSRNEAERQRRARLLMAERNALRASDPAVRRAETGPAASAASSDSSARPTSALGSKQPPSKKNQKSKAAHPCPKKTTRKKN